MMPAKTHGHSRSTDPLEVKAYRAWVHMLERCTKPETQGYARYGGRGISVYSEWVDYPAFLRDVGLPPTQGHVLDREDNEGGYVPGNVRWVTQLESLRNKTNPGYFPAKRVYQGPRVRRLHARGWSTRKIARYLGVSKSYVHRIVQESRDGQG